MIRLGIVGYGFRVSHLMRLSFRKVDPDIRVVGVVDPDEAGVLSRLEECDSKDVVFYDTLSEMMRHAKIDALVIGTRCDLHSKYAIEAAKYDIPLFLEKPVATSLDDAIKLEMNFAKAKCEVLVSFPLRVSSLCQLAKEYIDNGAVGKAEHVCATNYVPYGTVYWESFYRNYDCTQGLFVQKGTHDIDYLIYLMGEPVKRVAAMDCKGRVFGGNKPSGLYCSKCQEAETCLESPVNRKRNGSSTMIDDHLCVFGVDCGTPADGMNEDSSSALLEFASGAHGVYTQVFYSRRNAARRGAIISGYNGTLEFDWYSGKFQHIWHHKPYSAEIKMDNQGDHFGGDMELAQNFINIIKGKEKSRADMRVGLNSIYACLAAKESTKTGMFVDVRQLSY